MQHVGLLVLGSLLFLALTILTHRSYQQQQAQQTLQKQFDALQHLVSNSAGADYGPGAAQAMQQTPQLMPTATAADLESSDAPFLAQRLRPSKAVPGSDGMHEKARKNDAVAPTMHPTEYRALKHELPESASKEENCLQDRVKQHLDSEEAFIMWAGEDLPGVMRMLQQSGRRDPHGDKLVLHSDLCIAARVASELQTMRDHVLVAGLNENWGAMSTYVANRTIDWGSQEQHWEDGGCPKDMILNYFNRAEFRGLVTVQHQIWAHPKVVSLPLGVNFYQEKHRSTMIRAITRARQRKRTRQLTINNSGSDHRAKINKLVAENMEFSVRNTFEADTQSVQEDQQYIAEIQSSKFVLCPSGAGWDTYRLWEVLYLGAIPIVERSDGFDKTLDGLPVLVVDDFAQVNKAFLTTAYERIVSQCDSFNFRKLTSKWWEEDIFAMLDTKPSNASDVSILQVDIENSNAQIFEETKAALISGKL